MSIQEAQRPDPPAVNPDFALFGRLVDGKDVRAVGDVVCRAVLEHIFRCLGANFRVDPAQFVQTTIDIGFTWHHMPEPTAATLGGMERPGKFEHTRFLGDKRTQLVYDLDTWDDATIIDDIVASEVGLCFGPDTLVEARNRGYTAATPGKTRRHRAPRA